MTTAKNRRESGPPKRALKAVGAPASPKHATKASAREESPQKESPKASADFVLTRGDSIFTTRARANLVEMLAAAREFLREGERELAALDSGSAKAEVVARRASAHARRLFASMGLATESLQGITTEMAQVFRQALEEMTKGENS